jgi:DNA-binding MarR family transcriptional regulator
VIQDEPGRETTVRIPHRTIRDKRGHVFDDVVDDERVSVTLWDDSFPLPIRLYFKHHGVNPPLLGFELGDEAHRRTTLEPAQAVRIAKNLPVYISYAHAILLMDRANVKRALEILNEIGTTRRGLPGRFLRIVADEYMTRVRQGDSAPITSIAEAHAVDKSTASRWVKEGRRRGFIKEAHNA